MYEICGEKKLFTAYLTYFFSIFPRPGLLVKFTDLTNFYNWFSMHQCNEPEQHISKLGFVFRFGSQIHFSEGMGRIPTSTTSPGPTSCSDLTPKGRSTSVPGAPLFGQEHFFFSEMSIYQLQLKLRLKILSKFRGLIIENYYQYNLYISFPGRGFWVNFRKKCGECGEFS